MLSVVLTKFFEPVWLFFQNAFSTQKIHFDVFGAIVGVTSIVVITAIAVYLILKLTKPENKQKITSEDYLDDLLKKLQNFKHRWNWGIPFWSKGYKKQIPRRVISYKK